MAEEIGKIKSRGKASVGKPRRVKRQRSKIASFSSSVSNTTGSSYGNFYSPELSTDFLELPQSIDEQRNFYRFFYQSDPFVGQAIDLHTELPLSKIRMSLPEANNPDLARRSLSFCENWSNRVGYLHRLIEIVHEFYLLGEVFIFCEDTSPDMPEDVRTETIRELDPDRGAVEKQIERPDADERSVSWLAKNYKGWTAVRILPPEQIHMESFPFTDEKIIELVPDSKTKNIIDRANSYDPQAKRIADSMPQGVVEAIRAGKNIPLNTDPDAGSFVYYLSRKRSQYETRGHSILERCMRTLVYRDKLRQAQTSIASRHMTPIRLVSAEGADIGDIEAIREQVDIALQDPDYSIVSNFKIDWEEQGASQRLLDLNSEYDMTDRQLYSGLGVTESLLSGESSYSGDRINLEVINTRYMLLREVLQDMTNEYILKPMCKRMGFIELNEYGEEQVIYPKLSFTRLALRDNQDTFDALFNLYQKGSIDVDIILELLNVDPITAREKLKNDLFTLNDATFNEVLRGIYGDVGRDLAENSDAAQKIADTLGLSYEKPSEDEDRF